VQYAALIIEPMIQGAGGMKFHSADFLASVAALCHRAGVGLFLLLPTNFKNVQGHLK
jgi:adenosylmethionine-8-amino-7-oxononanoate aminotransferase